MRPAPLPAARNDGSRVSIPDGNCHVDGRFAVVAFGMFSQASYRECAKADIVIVRADSRY